MVFKTNSVTARFLNMLDILAKMTLNGFISLNSFIEQHKNEHNYIVCDKTTKVIFDEGPSYKVVRIFEHDGEELDILNYFGDNIEKDTDLEIKVTVHGNYETGMYVIVDTLCNKEVYQFKIERGQVAITQLPVH